MKEVRTKDGSKQRRKEVTCCRKRLLDKKKRNNNKSRDTSEGHFSVTVKQSKRDKKTKLRFGWWWCCILYIYIYKSKWIVLLWASLKMRHFLMIRIDGGTWLHFKTTVESLEVKSLTYKILYKQWILFCSHLMLRCREMSYVIWL